MRKPTLAELESSLEAAIKRHGKDTRVYVNCYGEFCVVPKSAPPDWDATRIDTQEYRLAVCGEGDQAGQWGDKPHRLVYDLCDAVDQLNQKINRLTTKENAHNDLLEALKLTLAKVMQYMTFLDNQHSPDLQKVIKTAEAAIAKADQTP